MQLFCTSVSSCFDKNLSSFIIVIIFIIVIVDDFNLEFQRSKKKWWFDRWFWPRGTMCPVSLNSSPCPRRRKSDWFWKMPQSVFIASKTSFWVAAAGGRDIFCCFRQRQKRAIAHRWSVWPERFWSSFPTPRHFGIFLNPHQFLDGCFPFGAQFAFLFLRTVSSLFSVFPSSSPPPIIGSLFICNKNILLFMKISQHRSHTFINLDSRVGHI